MTSEPMTKVGQIITTKYKVQWHECEICGMPAQHRLTFLMPNCRTNPASSAYRHDDCSWCSDYETYACHKHERELTWSNPNGMSWCASYPLAKYKHMGFYKMEVKTP
jgi:hypothetical protein